MKVYAHPEDHQPGSVQALPGDLAIWFFIAAELLVFAVLFICFAEVRHEQALSFRQAEDQLARLPALAETLILICSSYPVVGAVETLRQGHARSASRGFLLSLSLGAAFCVLKILELHHDAELGMSLSGSSFDMFYLSLIVFHFMHVLMGMSMLSVVAWRSAHGTYADGAIHGAESVAAFWHMVDLLWVFLFVLVYVLS